MTKLIRTTCMNIVVCQRCSRYWVLFTPSGGSFFLESPTTHYLARFCLPRVVGCQFFAYIMKASFASPSCSVKALRMPFFLSIAMCAYRQILSLSVQGGRACNRLTGGRVNLMCIGFHKTASMYGEALEQQVNSV